MADIALSVANKVNVLPFPVIQHTFVAGEAIVAGAPVSVWGATGKVVNSDANGGSALLHCWGIALRTVAAGEAVTVLRLGFLEGYALAALDFDASVYVSNTVGRLGDAAGGTSMVVAKVVPAYGQPLGSTPDKILLVDCTRL